jgi:pyruvate/2-oxoglutarate dehydrogenase complex dihydrolipoamide acyltransferase (E2) component
MSRVFKLPDLGEGVHEGQIVRVLVAPGDNVREDQPLMEVETDKARVEIPSPYSGVVEKVHVSEGQLVNVGAAMVTFSDATTSPSLEGGGQGVGGATGAKAALEHQSRSTNPPTPSLEGRGRSALQRRHTPASPAVRKMARELGVDLDSITGSGPAGRVTRDDLNHAASGSLRPLREPAGARSQTASKSAPLSTLIAPSPQPSPPGKGRVTMPALVAGRVHHTPLPESLVIEPPPGRDEADQHGAVRRVPLTQARKTIANVMVQSWTSIPHATDFDDADVTELDHIRRGYVAPDGSDRKLTMLAFVVRAVVRALQRFPEFNASFDPERSEIIYKRYITIAVGVHTERGLVPMVIREANTLTIPQISDELHAIGEKARTATFSVNDTRGGTYTISNAGAMGGSRYSTPIITPGQAAVLAIGRTRWMPWVVEADGHRGLASRLIMPLSHSIDHRLLDGGQEVQFMQHIVGDLQNPARLLL